MSRLQEKVNRLLDRLPEGEFLTVADVGSMGGMEPEWRALEAHPRFRCIGFEPDEREFQRLKSDERHLYFNHALHKRAQEALEFYVSRESGKSSVLAPNTELLERFPFPERYQTREKIALDPDRVSTLDALLRNPSQAPDFLKLDTQGSEKNILEGGQRLLEESILGLKLEMEFLELYRGQPLFADLDRLLRGYGFELMDLRRVYWKNSLNRTGGGKGQLAFGDALYLKSPSYLLRQETNRSRSLKYLIICLVYGCLNPAMEVLDYLRRRPAREREDLERIEQTFREMRRRMSPPRLPGSRTLARWLSRVLWFLTRSDRGFSDADATLGNRWLY